MGIPLSIILTLFAFSKIALGQNYHVDKTCIPLCNSTSTPPNAGGAPCLCTPNANIPGCTVAPCGPGQVASGSYICQCVGKFQPYLCVTLQCDNGTAAESSHCQSRSSKASTYYPSSDYPSSNYPSSSYRSYKYPVFNRPSFESHPSHPSYTYPLPSHSSSYHSCNSYCDCEPYAPADCTAESKSPIVGGEPCACNPNMWMTGCTLKKCQEGDTGDNDYVCECTPTHSPDFCRMPRCTSE